MERTSVERTPTGSVVGAGAASGRPPLLPPSTSPAGTPTRDIDTLMGGQPLTETDSEGNTRFYPVFVKSDGTQCPVSAEYLRAMGIEWPPAPVQVSQDLETLEALASELYQQALANSQQPAANRSAHAPPSIPATTAAGRGDNAANSAPAAAAVRAGLRAVASAAAGSRDSRGRSTSPPFSPRGAHPRALEDAALRESAARGEGAGVCTGATAGGGSGTARG